MIRVEDVLPQQVILPTSSPQYTRPFLYVSTKSLHHPGCVPVCLFILWAADVIWMMLALSALTLFCLSILQSVCLPVRITITCFLLSPHTVNTEELDAGACWHLYRTTGIHIKHKWVCMKSIYKPAKVRAYSYVLEQWTCGANVYFSVENKWWS